MENFSDEEKYEVNQILGQRKRKGVLEYLVQWKSEDSKDDSWEPAKTITADCIQAVESFLLAQKEKKISKSKTRSVSRSRSRSSSRSRKTTVSSKAGKSSRSRSRGRQEQKLKSPPPSTPTEETKVRRSLRQKASAGTETTDVEETQDVKIVETKTSEMKEIKSATTSTADKTTDGSDTPQRVLRSSTMEQKKVLEVQRVHNEQRPVREDDVQPRSPIWKIADYIVIVLFVVSVIAAIFLFLEKFFDLEYFKQQAFPNLSTLKTRLVGGYHQVLDLCHSLWAYLGDAWLRLIELVKRPQPVAASSENAH